MAYYGADEQVEKVTALVEKKAQLEAALPVVDDTRAMQIEARLDKIDAALQAEIVRARAIGNEAAVRAAMGLDGQGGLSFQAQAPAGVGRLVRLPFYPSNTPSSTVGDYITGAGSATASTTVPVVTFASDASGAATDIVRQNGDAFTMKTPQISWATLRIVGFETAIDANNSSVSSTATVANSVPAAKLVCKDLKIGGGANLFTHEDYGDGDIYNADAPEFCGLRDYPLLKSPNVAEVNVAVVGVLAGNTAQQNNLTFSCNLLCEVLQDDNYGSHVPGPYARGAAMVRRGGSFIS